MNKKIYVFLLFITSAVYLLCGWTAFRNEGELGLRNVTSYETPTDTLNSKGEVIFKTEDYNYFGTSINSPVLIVGDYIYTANSKLLYKLDKNGNVKEKFNLDKPVNSTCRTVYENGNIYIPLSDGLIEAVKVNGDNITKLWISEEFGNQTLSDLTIYKDYLYSATTNGNASEGVFFCLNKNDGKTIWTYKGDTGYYWTNSVVYKDKLYFTGENGNMVIHSLNDDTVYDTVKVTDKKIRSGITIDKDNGVLYIISKDDGHIHKIVLNEAGEYVDHFEAPLVTKAEYCYSTSTPTLYDNRLYVGCSMTMKDENPKGAVAVIDKDTLKTIYTAVGNEYAEIKSSPLVNVVSSEPDIRCRVYVTENNRPGKLLTFADYKGNDKDISLDALYTPTGDYTQYCMDSVCVDSDGTLYYSNDSGALFKVANKEFKGLNGVKKANIKKASKKKVNIAFESDDEDTDTLVYAKFNSKKYKNVAIVSGNSYALTYKKLVGKNKSFMKKDTVSVKFKTRMKYKDEYIYSGYSKVYKYKFK